MNTKETREEIKALTNYELQQIKGGEEEVKKENEGVDPVFDIEID